MYAETSIGLAPTLEDPEVANPAEHDLSAEHLEQMLDVGELPVDDPVRMYMREIGGASLLRREDEIALAQAMRKGDTELEKRTNGLRFDPTVINAGMEARRTLTEANLRLVVSIAKKYTVRGVSLLDLIQEGNLGLMRAVGKFDHTRGFRFSTYATWWIRQAITRCLADQTRTIRVPSHVVDTISRVNHVSERLTQEYWREPTLEEIGQEMDLPPRKVGEIIKTSWNPLSLELSVANGVDEGGRIGDLIPAVTLGEDPLDAASSDLLRESIDKALHLLTERERHVLRLRFGLDGGQTNTLEQVGRTLGITRERVRQIEFRALNKLRRPESSGRLRDFFEA